MILGNPPSDGKGIRVLDHPPASGYEIEKQHHHRDNKQKVDQGAADVKAEAEKPHNQQNRENCPKHISLRSDACVPETFRSVRWPVTLRQSRL